MRGVSNKHCLLTFFIASVIIRSSTCAVNPLSDYGDCHFRGHLWDLIRSGTGKVISECVTWALGKQIKVVYKFWETFRSRRKI